MGFDGENGKVKASSWELCKSKGRKKNTKVEDDVSEDEGVETGCWLKFRFIGSCISSRSKVDSSVSGTSTHFGNCCCFTCNFHFSSLVFPLFYLFSGLAKFLFLQ